MHLILHQIEAESVLLTMIPKIHFTQNVTCFVGVHHVKQPLICLRPFKGFVDFTILCEL